MSAPSPDLSSLGPFADWLGLQVQSADGDQMTATWTARPELHQPFGIVHGGVHCSIVETLASIAGTLWLDGKGSVVGVNNSTDFLRAVSEGELTSVATPLHRGRLQQLWTVVTTDVDDRVVARGNVRLQNLYRD